MRGSQKKAAGGRWGSRRPSAGRSARRSLAVRWPRSSRNPRRQEPVGGGQSEAVARQGRRHQADQREGRDATLGGRYPACSPVSLDGAQAGDHQGQDAQCAREGIAFRYGGRQGQPDAAAGAELEQGP